MLIPDLVNVLLVTQDFDLTFVILQSERFLLVKAHTFYKLLPAVIDTTTQNAENVIIFNMFIKLGVIRKNCPSLHQMNIVIHWKISPLHCDETE